VKAVLVDAVVSLGVELLSNQGKRWRGKDPTAAIRHDGLGRVNGRRSRLNPGLLLRGSHLESQPQIRNGLVPHVDTSNEGHETRDHHAELVTAGAHVLEAERSLGIGRRSTFHALIDEELHGGAGDPGVVLIDDDARDVTGGSGILCLGQHDAKQADKDGWRKETHDMSST
jgi:hypothetical protein